MMMETVISRSLRLMFAGSAALMLAQSASAQDAPIQRVEITGSAIKRIDAETAVPVTVVRMADLKKEGITTIEQVLSNLSVSQASQAPARWSACRPAARHLPICAALAPTRPWCC